MALTEEQAAAVQALAGADPKDVASELKSKANPAFQHIFDQGYKKADKLTSDDKTAAEKARDKAQDEVKRLEGELVKARSGNPDVEQIRREHKDEVDRLTRERQDAEKVLREKLTGLRKGGVLSELLTYALDPTIGSLRPSFVENYLRNPRWADRIALDEKSEEPDAFDVLQEGKKIPIATDDDTRRGKLVALAKEMRKWAEANEPDAVRVGVENGAGVTAGGRDGTQEYDPVADGKARAQRQAGGDRADEMHKLSLR